MTPNAKPSEHLSLLATIDPVSTGPGTVTTGWVSAANFFAFMAIISVGAFGAAATVDAKFQQATDNVGTGVKDVAGKAITQLLAAGGNNRQAILNMKAADLDVEGQFKFIRLSVADGAAASLLAAFLIGAYPRYEDGAQFNQAGVAQVV